MAAGGDGRERASYETLARVTLPFTLHPVPFVPFLQIPRLSTGVRVSHSRCLFAQLCSHGGVEDGTSRARDPIWTTTKISIPLLKGLSRFAVPNVTEYRHYKAFFVKSDSKVRIYKLITKIRRRFKRAEILSCARAYTRLSSERVEGKGFPFEK